MIDSDDSDILQVLRAGLADESLQANGRVLPERQLAERLGLGRARLRRLLDVAGERYIHVADAMPTRENFSGTTDRGPIDRAIAQADEQRRAEGRASCSRATETGA